MTIAPRGSDRISLVTRASERGRPDGQRTGAQRDDPEGERERGRDREGAPPQPGRGHEQRERGDEMRDVAAPERVLGEQHHADEPGPDRDRHPARAEALQPAVAVRTGVGRVRPREHPPREPRGRPRRRPRTRTGDRVRGASARSSRGCGAGPGPRRRRCGTGRTGRGPVGAPTGATPRTRARARRRARSPRRPAGDATRRAGRPRRAPGSTRRLFIENAAPARRPMHDRATSRRRPAVARARR